MPIQTQFPIGFFNTRNSSQSYRAAVEYMRTLDVFPFIQDTKDAGATVPNLGTTGAALDGTANNVTLVNEGLAGDSCLRWNAIDGRILVSNHASIAALTNQEWVFICRPTSLGETNLGALAIWENGAQDLSGHAICFLNNSASSLRCLFVDSGIDTATITNVGVTLDEWVVLFTRYDASTRKAHIYVGRDGTVTECTYATQTPGGTALTPNAGDLYIGQRKNGGLTWDGLIQVAACANRALTDAERLEIVERALGAVQEGSEFTLSGDPAALTKYGGAYPITYQFTLPGSSAGLTVEYKKAPGDAWTALTEKTTSDTFNGIDAVRFDYAGNAAYVSMAFGASSDAISLRFLDGAEPVTVTYAGTSAYYDNRTAAVVFTADDWNDTYNASFETACQKAQANNLWISPAIITGSAQTGPATWAAIQSAVNNGYVEPCSHSRIWTHPPYADLEDAVLGSVADLTANLTPPPQQRRGATKYYPAFITPGGGDDAALHAYLESAGFLAERSVIVNNDTFASWDYLNDKFSFYGYSIRMGSDSGSTNSATLNAKYDAVYAVGGIYHLMCHPYNVDWSAYGDAHLAHISGHTDVWYVGYGHLYLYRYFAHMNKVSVAAA